MAEVIRKYLRESPFFFFSSEIQSFIFANTSYENSGTENNWRFRNRIQEIKRIISKVNEFHSFLCFIHNFWAKTRMCILDKTRTHIHKKSIHRMKWYLRRNEFDAKSARRSLFDVANPWWLFQESIHPSDCRRAGCGRFSPAIWSNMNNILWHSTCFMS